MIPLLVYAIMTCAPAAATNAARGMTPEGPEDGPRGGVAVARMRASCSSQGNYSNLLELVRDALAPASPDAQQTEILFRAASFDWGANCQAVSIPAALDGLTARVQFERAFLERCPGDPRVANVRAWLGDDLVRQAQLRSVQSAYVMAWTSWPTNPDVAVEAMLAVRRTAKALGADALVGQTAADLRYFSAAEAWPWQPAEIVP